jgi:predicted amidophosphoribosyltransferase
VKARVTERRAGLNVHISTTAGGQAHAQLTHNRSLFLHEGSGIRRKAGLTKPRIRSTEKRPSMNIITAHKYVSPRSRPLTPEEQEVRRTAYALKVPTPEACETAARAMAPLLDAAEHPETHIVLMPVPASTGNTDANRRFADAIAQELRRAYRAGASERRRVQVKITVGRKHPVESSCVRRKRGARGLRGKEHALIRVAPTLTANGTAYYFVDNMATTGATLDACRAALGFGDGIVWADEGRTLR